MTKTSIKRSRGEHFGQSFQDLLSGFPVKPSEPLHKPRFVNRTDLVENHETGF